LPNENKLLQELLLILHIISTTPRVQCQDTQFAPMLSRIQPCHGSDISRTLLLSLDKDIVNISYQEADIDPDKNGFTTKKINTGRQEIHYTVSQKGHFAFTQLPPHEN